MVIKATENIRLSKSYVDNIGYHLLYSCCLHLSSYDFERNEFVSCVSSTNKQRNRHNSRPGIGLFFCDTGRSCLLIASETTLTFDAVQGTLDIHLRSNTPAEDSSTIHMVRDVTNMLGALGYVFLDVSYDLLSAGRRCATKNDAADFKPAIQAVWL